MLESHSEGEITLFSGGWREGTGWERQGKGNVGGSYVRKEGAEGE
jgi:hypothetical protein